MLAGLLESIVERIADVIERVSGDMDRASGDVFSRRAAARRQAARAASATSARCWKCIGQSGELIAKARESLASLSRLLAFVQQSQRGHSAGCAHAAAHAVA